MSPGRSTFILVGLLTTTALASALPVAQVPALAREDAIAEARELAAMMSGEGDAFENAVAIAKAATLMQAGVATAPALAVHASAGAAIAELAARHGVAVPADDLARVAALDAPIAGALASVVGAFLAFDDASTLAVARGDGDMGEALLARNALLSAVFDLRAQLALGGTLPIIELPPALILHADAGCVDDTYTANVALLIDTCGDDSYRNNAGGGLDGTAALFDRSGDDLYDSLGTAGGTNGGGMRGSGFLVDEEGNDRYFGLDDGVNGGGFAGSGFLMDVAGDDVYDTGWWGWGTNGGGYIDGDGMLVDRSGNDFYRGSYAAVNGGGFQGDGLLYDGQGNDVYLAESSGTNGGAARGTGRLVDVSGDDGYTARRGGANGGAVSGDGLLWDGDGLDRYFDEEGGSGIDVTVDPKGDAGAQMDR